MRRRQPDHLRRAFAERLRHSESGRYAMQDAVVVVAAEELAATIAAERHRDFTTREARYRQRGKCRAIEKRLVEVLMERRHQGEQVVDREDFLPVLGAECSRNSRSVLALVVLRLTKADGESLHRATGELRHQGYDRRTVDATREECAERNIADDARLDAPREQGRELGQQIALGEVT